MPTTSWIDASFGLRAIPDRTDETGTAVKDISGREDAFIQTLLDRGGTLTPADAFVPQKGTGDLDVDIGSGTADADHYVVGSTVTGQAPFVVQLQQTTATVTLDAADADDRWDQIYLVVRDTTLDGNTDGHTLSRLAYRKGDAGTTPTKPGADAEWVHYELIASIYVTGGTNAIANDDITDERAASSFLQKLFDDSVQRTAAAVFGKVLDPRYVETGGGDTVTGTVKWTAGQPEIERTDADGNVWLIRVDFPQPDSPRLNVRKNGNLHARFQWDEPNSQWVLTGGLRSTGQLVMNDIINMGDQQIKNVLAPSGAQDAATKKWTESNFAERKSGSYTGDGTSSRTISVGFTPTYVAVTADSATSSGNAESGFTTSTSRGTILDDGQDVGMASTFKLVSGGFQVDGALNLNEDGVSYSYIALR